MLLLSDPAVAAVPARNCDEELLDVHEHPELMLDERKQDPAGHWARLRDGVLTRLLQAQRALPRGLRLLIIEGYRPVALRQRYFAEHRAELARVHPGWPNHRLEAEASKHIAPPAVAPHPCGAAVDLTLADDEELRDRQGRLIDDDYADQATEDALQRVKGHGRPSRSHSGESPLLRVRLPEEFNDAASEAAREAGTSRSEWVRQALAEATRKAS
jgi:hypothetical protein